MVYDLMVLQSEKLKGYFYLRKTILNHKGEKKNTGSHKDIMLSEINRSPKSTFCMIPRASLLARTVKNLPAMLETQVRSPRVGKIPWKGEWQPTPAFLPGEFHVQRSLVGYS